MIYQILMPTWAYLGVKIRPKRLQVASKTPQDALTWCPRRPKSRPTGAQDASRTAQEQPERHSGSGPKVPWSQEPPKRRPRAAQTPSGLRFWTILETLFGSFLMIFEGCWKAFMAKYCLPPDPLLLRGTHPDLLYLEDARWRERGLPR